MASTVQVEVVSAEGELYSGQANFISAPAEGGDLGIYPSHTPLLTRLRPGGICLKLEDEPDFCVFISGGILEIQPDCVTVLLDTALREGDADEAAAQAALEAAEAAMEGKSNKDIDFANASNSLAEAAARLEWVKKMKQN